MDGYSASEDAGPSFCIGHHEVDRSVFVTPQMIRKVHESNVSFLLMWRAVGFMLNTNMGKAVV